MAVKSEKLVSDLFNQAVSTYVAALETGSKAQEEVADWWSKTLKEAGTVEDLQKRMQAFATGSMPLAQKNAEECIEVMQKNMQASLDLLKQAFESGQAESVAEVQSKTRDLWEASLKAMRENTEAVVKANARAMEGWAELMNQGNGQAPAKS